jgi:hypothetical protein
MGHPETAWHIWPEGWTKYANPLENPGEPKGPSAFDAYLRGLT